MAVIKTLSNHYKYQLMKKNIDLSTDTLKIILMDNAFTFDKDAHATLADVTANQLATLNGYTQDDETLTTVVLTEDDVNDKGNMACDDVSWTAAGGDIGPTGAAVILNFSAVSETEFFTTQKDQDFTGGGTHWTNVDLGGAFNDTTDLSLTATVVAQYCKISFTDIGTPLVAGGRYRLEYDYSETVAGFEFKLVGGATQTLGDAVAGTAQTIDFIADEAYTVAEYLGIFSKTGAAAQGDFDNFSIKQIATVIGCIDYGVDYTVPNGSSFWIKDIEIDTT
jgi:hypothetical protein